MSKRRPLSIGVVGGGAAGYLAALALRRWDRSVSVTLVESSRIPVIGVGEATTPPIVPFLHGFLGLDIHDFFDRVRPTWKLGIRFDWGRPGDDAFNYAFGGVQLQDAHAHGSEITDYSLTSMLMRAHASLLLRRGRPAAKLLSGYAHEHAIDEDTESLLPLTSFAYHLDNRRFVAYLHRAAEKAGVRRVDATVESVTTTVQPDGERTVASLQTDVGDLEFDFYLDCTGFRSMLLGRALDEPYVDYRSSLYCDTAVVADVPNGATLPPYTRAETMDCGWLWHIPQMESTHCGYVYDSQACTEEDAIQHMRRRLPEMGQHRTIRFRTGRRRRFWAGNVVALGNAYGFVEPLESTALHMVLVEIIHLIRVLNRGALRSDIDHVNDRVGRHWDFLRWFLAVHYRFNRRSSSAFWRRCRAEVDVGGLTDAIDHFRERGLLSAPDARSPDIFADDAVFSVRGLDLMLWGQGVPTQRTRPRLTPQRWQQVLKDHRGICSRGLPQAEALQRMQAEPQILDNLVRGERSWCRLLGEDLPRQLDLSGRWLW